MCCKGYRKPLDGFAGRLAGHIRSAGFTQPEILMPLNHSTDRHADVLLPCYGVARRNQEEESLASKDMEFTRSRRVMGFVVRTHSVGDGCGEAV